MSSSRTTPERSIVRPSAFFRTKVTSQRRTKRGIRSVKIRKASPTPSRTSSLIRSFVSLIQGGKSGGKGRSKAGKRSKSGGKRSKAGKRSKSGGKRSKAGKRSARIPARAFPSIPELPASSLRFSSARSAVVEQWKRYGTVLKICKVNPAQVRILAHRLGLGNLGIARRPAGFTTSLSAIALRARRSSKAKGGGGKGGGKDRAEAHRSPFTASRNVCHVLGVAMSMLFEGDRNFAYPVRVAGSGVAKLAFHMSDGTILAVTDVTPRRGRGAADRGGVAKGGSAIPRAEFEHEIRAMRAAARHKFTSFDVPRVLRAVVLRGAHGSRIGVMQQTTARGETVDGYLARASVPASVRVDAARMHGRALAEIHRAGWIHGDLHTQNVFVEPRRGGSRSKRPRSASRHRITVIDWGRANTRRALMASCPATVDCAGLWKNIMRYEVAFPYRDMALYRGRRYAEGFLSGYLSGRGPAITSKLTTPEEVRRDFEGLVARNVNGVFQALRYVSSNRRYASK